MTTAVTKTGKREGKSHVREIPIAPGGREHEGRQVCTKQRAFEKSFKVGIKIASFANKLFILPLNS